MDPAEYDAYRAGCLDRLEDTDRVLSRMTVFMVRPHLTADAKLQPSDVLPPRRPEEEPEETSGQDDTADVADWGEEEGSVLLRAQLRGERFAARRFWQSPEGMGLDALLEAKPEDADDECG